MVGKNEYSGALALLFIYLFILMYILFLGRRPAHCIVKTMEVVSVVS